MDAKVSLYIQFYHVLEAHGECQAFAGKKFKFPTKLFSIQAR